MHFEVLSRHRDTLTVIWLKRALDKHIHKQYNPLTLDSGCTYDQTGNYSFRAVKESDVRLVAHFRSQNHNINYRTAIQTQLAFHFIAKVIGKQMKLLYIFINTVFKKEKKNWLWKFNKKVALIQLECY